MKIGPGVSAVVLMALVLVMVPILDVTFLMSTSFTLGDGGGQLLLLLAVGTLNVISLAFVLSVIRFFHVSRTTKLWREATESSR